VSPLDELAAGVQRGVLGVLLVVLGLVAVGVARAGLPNDLLVGVSAALAAVVAFLLLLALFVEGLREGASG
jgi:hypothetical protein